MKLKIKRVDRNLPLPTYKTNGAVALDLYTRKTVTIKPQKVEYIPLNVIIQTPPGKWVLLAPRSSTHKLGILQANGIGIVDQDFCGNDDEYHFAALNYTNQDVIIEKGTRIAQIIPLTFDKFELIEVDNMENKNRGGFGSTGTK